MENNSAEIVTQNVTRYFVLTWQDIISGMGAKGEGRVKEGNGEEGKRKKHSEQVRDKKKLGK